MRDWIYDSFKMYWPRYAERTVNYEHCNDGTLLVELDDGEKYVYDDEINTLRHLPQNRNSMSEEECRQEFRARLNILMRRRCVNQTMLSEMTGISQCALSNYVRGKQIPSLYNLDKIAKALNCSLDDFRYF